MSLPRRPRRRLQHRRLYRAVGLDQNRNRRPAAPALIARKLMLLDVVLSEPHADWIATEAEKVTLFSEQFRVSLDDLPRRALIAEGEELRRTMHEKLWTPRAAEK